MYTMSLQNLFCENDIFKEPNNDVDDQYNSKCLIRDMNRLALYF